MATGSTEATTTANSLNGLQAEKYNPMKSVPQPMVLLF